MHSGSRRAQHRAVAAHWLSLLTTCLFIAIHALPAHHAVAAPGDEALRAFRTSYQSWKTVQKSGDYQRAIAPAQQTLDRALKHYGEQHDHTARVQVEFGELRRLASQFAEAETLLQTALETRQKKHKDDHADVAECHYQLAALYEMKRDTKKAREHLDKHEAMIKRLLGEDHLQFARSLQLRGAIERLEGDYALAETRFDQSLAICERKSRPGDLALADAQHELAYHYACLEHPSRGQAKLKLALKVYSRVYAKDHPEWAKAQSTLASLLQEEMDLERAVGITLEVLKVRQAKLGADHLYTSFTLNNLGNCYRELGQYNRAIEVLQQAVAAKEHALGPQSIEVAKSKTNLAICYAELRQFDKAREMVERSLEISAACGLQEHDEHANKLMTLGTICIESGDLKAGEQYYQQALVVFEKRGIEGGSGLMLRHNMAVLYSALGDREKAYELVRGAVDMYTKQLGATHPLTGEAWLNLGAMLKEEGRTAEAEEPTNKGYEILQQGLGPGHPTAIRAAMNKSSWLTAANRKADAIKLLDRTLRDRRVYDATVLPGLPEGTLQSFLNERMRDLGKSLTIALGDDANIDPHADMVAAWIVNWKGLTGEIAWNQQRLLRSDTPEANAVRKELADVQNKLASISMQRGTLEDFARQQTELEQLQRRREGLLLQISKLTGEVAPADDWVELDAVRKAIPRGSVLVEFIQYVRTDQVNSDNRTHVPYMLAAVIPRHGEGRVALVRLGRSAPIQHNLAHYQHAFAISQFALRKDERASEALLREPLAEFARLLLEPLLPTIGKYEQWIISADGPGWIVPWAALPLDDKTYVVEKHALTFVATSRDLVRASSPAPAKGAVIVANPNFDLGVPADFKGPKPCGPLPGSAEEAKAVAALLNASKPAIAPIVYDRDTAVEQTIKTLERPEVLLLSTHGFFLFSHGSQAPNPFLRCGLALAGVNRSLVTEGDDGMLTGMEVLSMNLTGSKLVILSACDTNVGDVLSGEGTIGLRQAFQLAGAQQVLATQWPIPDRETATLMTEFFRHYSKKSDASIALQQAQIAMIKARRAKGGAAHPIYWAAFSVTGAGALKPSR